MRRLILAGLLVVSFVTAQAQNALDQDTTAQDTILLSLQEVLKMTLAYHPVVKQANLLEREAEARIRESRGQLDPKLGLDYDLKEFKEKEYYNLLTTSFKIPTNFGIDPKVEFYKNSGEFLNEQNFISDETDNEQLAIGLSASLGRGLFYDERRNIIQRAEAFSQIAEAEQIKETNKILFTVVKDYWSWYQFYQKIILLSQAIDLAENLFDRTLIDFEFGEAAVVDTLQAKINYQKRIVDYEKTKLDFELAKLKLSRHLWSDNLQPIELRDNVMPDANSIFFSPEEDELRTDIEFAMTSHPEIGKLEGKRNEIDADLRLARENLKPQVDLSYSLIDAPVNPDLETTSVDFGDNYKMGIDFSFPIFLRKERGKLQQTRLKLQSNELEFAQNQIQIRNDVLGAYAQSSTLERLLEQYLGVSLNYRRLLEAEIINLQNGETDLFKLNIQQDKYIEAQTDYIDAFTKWEKSKAEYYHSIGSPLLGLDALFGNETN